MVASPRPDDRPLAAARRRLSARPHKRRPRRADSPSIQAQYIAVRSEGVPMQRAAVALGIGKEVAGELERRPETQVEILKRRELLKTLTMVEVGKTILPAWQLARQSVADGDTKGFDATMRGLHAVEKIQAGATGEGLVVRHEGQVQVDQRPALEQLRVLIGVVTGQGNGATS